MPRILDRRPQRLAVCERDVLRLLFTLCTAAAGDELLAETRARRAGNPHPGDGDQPYPHTSEQFKQSRCYVPVEFIQTDFGFPRHVIENSLRSLVQKGFLGCQREPVDVGGAVCHMAFYWPCPEKIIEGLSGDAL